MGIAPSQLNNEIAQIHIPLTSFVDAETAAGTPLTLFVDAAATLPGFSVADSESIAIRWNDHATPGDIMASIPLPQDMVTTADISVHYMLSKTGATVGDAVTMESSITFQTVAALHDADTPVVDTSSAITGDDAAKTVTEVSATVANADIPAPPAVLTIKVHPTDGTLGTDDLFLHDVWIEYTRNPA